MKGRYIKIITLASILLSMGMFLLPVSAFAATTTVGPPTPSQANFDQSIYNTLTAQQQATYNSLTVDQRAQFNQAYNTLSPQNAFDPTSEFSNLGVTPGSYTAVNAGQMSATQLSQFNNLTSAQQQVYNAAMTQNPNADIQTTLNTAAGSVKSNAPPANNNSCGISLGSCALGIVTSIVNIILVTFIEPIIAGFLMLAGIGLDAMIKYSVINLTTHINALVAINTGWGIVRDLCNMSFIFVLVYNGIMLMFGKGNKGIITAVVIAAVIINFSLFFTKVEIDASNIIATSFYNVMVPPGQSGITVGAFTLPQGGLSSAVMNGLQLSSLYSSNILSANAGTAAISLVNVVGGSIFMLIATFMFLAMFGLFLARYIAFVFLLIISPIGYMSAVIPGLRKYSSQFWDTLNGQVIFAPLFMLLMYITLLIMNNLPLGAANIGLILQNPTASPFDAIINYCIVIGLLLGTVLISKSQASKGASAVGAIAGKVSAFAGGTLFGATAFAGRQTIGRIGKAVADNENLQAAQNEKGWKGAGARLALYTGKKAQSGSFDYRNAKLPTNAIGDAIEGTIGRTKFGEKLGLRNVNIPSIDMSGAAAKAAGANVGKAGTKGFKELQADYKKIVRDKKSAEAGEVSLANAKKKILEGAKIGASGGQIDEMEKALTKLSDKETETLVASNRELLQSQEFGNRISSKQLDALMKSNEFSESEKGDLRDARFKALTYIDDVAGLAALKIATGARTLEQEAAAKRVRTAQGRVKGLTDSELEMIDPTYFSNKEFIGQMRGGQFESITKSARFTSGQKKIIRETRLAPLLDATDNDPVNPRPSYAPNPTVVKEMITKSLSAKEVAGLAGTKVNWKDASGTTINDSILIHPDVLEQYTNKLLKRMGDEMSTGDIQMMRDAIKKAAAAQGASKKIQDLADWLEKPDGINNFS